MHSRRRLVEYTAAVITVAIVVTALVGGVATSDRTPMTTPPLDAAALPAIIAGIRAAGYGFVTLDALLEGA